MPLSPKKQQFTLQSNPKNLQPFLKDTLSPLLLEAGFEPKIKDHLLVALGEAITNSIRHAYDNQPDKPIEVTLEDSGDQMVFRIRDFGKKVDLERIKEKSTPKLPPETPGGLGVYFIKTIMDCMEYNMAHAQGNELILIKKK